MEDIVNLIATDSSASDISSKIKDALFNRASEKIEGLRPQVALSMFDTGSQEEE
jgi:hypothetical protein